MIYLLYPSMLEFSLVKSNWLYACWISGWISNCTFVVQVLVGIKFYFGFNLGKILQIELWKCFSHDCLITVLTFCLRTNKVLSWGELISAKFTTFYLLLLGTYLIIHVIFTIKLTLLDKNLLKMCFSHNLFLFKFLCSNLWFFLPNVSFK